MPGPNHSSNWHVRCVSVPGPDTDLTLHVAFDNARYIFGCGEGTQRTYVQKRLGLKGVEAIFLLNAENRARMGLPGMIMSAADSGIPHLQIIGGPDTSHFISTFRPCVMREQFELTPRSLPIGQTPDDVNQVFQSPNVTVKAIALVPPRLRSTPLPKDRAPIDLATFRPDFAVTRPTLFSRVELEAWRELVARSMFQRSYISNNPDQEKLPKAPFVKSDGTYAANWPENRFPLPMPTAEEQATDMVYILEPPPVRGKFDAKRAEELGVPHGPIRGKLIRGEDIEVDDPEIEGGKRTVKPSDCLSGGGPASVLIVVACSDANVQSLLDSAAIRQYTDASNRASQGRVHLVVHRISSAVSKRSDYQAWMESFGPDTQHWIALTDGYSTDIVFRSSAWKLVDLAALDRNIFHHPFNASQTSFEPETLPPNVTHLQPNYQIKMHPPAPMEIVPCHEKDAPLPPFDRYAALESAQKALQDMSVATRRAISNVRRAVAEMPKAAPFPGSEIEVTTLGTGSACPSKYRNVSATLLRIPDIQGGQPGAILLDCGEGTLGQMRRFYGPDGIKSMYKELKMIFISHMHADHHLGLQRILEDRFQHGVSSPLYIIGPSNMVNMLQESAGWQRPASDVALNNVIFLINQRMSVQKQINTGSGDRPMSPTGRKPTETVGIPPEWGQEDIFCGARRWPERDVLEYSSEVLLDQWTHTRTFLESLNLSFAHVPLVEHRGAAHGLVLAHRSGWQIAYSGDTKPCANFIEAGRGSTLLIHEATLEDDKPEMATRKGHSTFSQAVEVGRQMRAQHILLNHFSQRYPKMPKMPVPEPPPDAGDATPPGSPSAESPKAGGGSPVQQHVTSPKLTPTSPRYKGKKPWHAAEPVVSISFDFMSIKVGEMWKMAHYMEPISLLFPEEEDEGDNPLEAVKKDMNVVPSSMSAKENGEQATLEGRGRSKRASPTALHAQSPKKKKTAKKTKASWPQISSGVGDISLDGEQASISDERVSGLVSPVMNPIQNDEPLPKMNGDHAQDPADLEEIAMAEPDESQPGSLPEPSSTAAALDSASVPGYQWDVKADSMPGIDYAAYFVAETASVPDVGDSSARHAADEGGEGTALNVPEDGDYPMELAEANVPEEPTLPTPTDNSLLPSKDASSSIEEHNDGREGVAPSDAGADARRTFRLPPISINYNEFSPAIRRQIISDTAELSIPVGDKAIATEAHAERKRNSLEDEGDDALKTGVAKE